MSNATLVYDDDCGFCTWWASWLADRSEIELVGFSELDDDLRARLPDDYEACSHLVTDGRVYSCGASIEAAFARTDVGEPLAPLLGFFGNFEEYDNLREWGYHAVADNRSLAGRILSKSSLDDDGPPNRRERNR